MNTLAPQFSLPDQEGKIHTLSDYRGQWVVLYFYPKDDTPGCTIEACSFRDMQALFAEKNTVILGVSKDTEKSHLKFAEKFTLNFPLLSDTTGTTIEAYGAWAPKKMFGKSYLGILRNTVLINPDGEIAKEYPNVDPVAHAEQLLKDLDEMAKA